MRYKAIVEQIVADIREDKLSPGQRMPSLRQLATQHQVSMTTALNSYRSLEESGWGCQATVRFFRIKPKN
jgi:DNA-binding transcriptional regulator YhcF (GntR family)